MEKADNAGAEEIVDDDEDSGTLISAQAHREVIHLWLSHAEGYVSMRELEKVVDKKGDVVKRGKLFAEPDLYELAVVKEKPKKMPLTSAEHSRKTGEDLATLPSRSQMETSPSFPYLLSTLKTSYRILSPSSDLLRVYLAPLRMRLPAEFEKNSDDSNVVASMSKTTPRRLSEDLTCPDDVLRELVSQQTSNHDAALAESSDEDNPMSDVFDRATIQPSAAVPATAVVPISATIPTLARLSSVPIV